MERQVASWLVPSAVAGVVTVWASAFIAIRTGLHGYSPAQLALLRLAVASVLFALCAVVQGIRVPSRHDWPHVAVVGVTGFALYLMLVNIGETRVSAGMASFAVSTGPVFTAILAAVFLGERMPRKAWGALAVSISGGVVLLFGARSRFEFEPYVVVLLGAALTQAIYFTLQKPLVQRYGGMTVTCWAVWCGTACLLPFLPDALRAVPHAPWRATLAAVYLGVLPTVVGFAAWAFVLSRAPVGRVTASLYAVPPVASLIGWLLLNERPSTVGIAGGLVSVGGVALFNREYRKGRQ